MLIRRTFISVVALLWAMCLSAQDELKEVQLRWGAKHERSEWHGMLGDLVGSDETGVYLWTRADRKSKKKEGASAFLLHYDTAMNLLRSVPLDLSMGDKKDEREVNKIVLLKDKLYVFSVFSDSKEKEYVLYVQDIDKGTLEGKGEARVLQTIDYSTFLWVAEGGVRIEVSPDNSKILVYHIMPAGQSKSGKYGFILYDQDLNVLAEHVKRIPQNLRGSKGHKKNSHFFVEDFQVNNDGDVFFLTLTRVLPRSGTERKWSVVAYMHDEEEPRKYRIGNNKYELEGMKMALTEEQIVCGALYHEPSNNPYESALGMYAERIDIASGETVYSEYGAFSSEFIEAFWAALGKRRKNKTELLLPEIDEIFVDDKGYLCMLTEQRIGSTTTFVIETTTPSKYREETVSEQEYNHIVVAKFGEHGKPEYFFIPKRQKAKHGGTYLSYLSMHRGNDIYFFYWDDRENMEIDEPGLKRPLYAMKDTWGDPIVFVAVKLDAEGKLSRKVLLEKEGLSVEEGGIVKPAECKVISDEALLLIHRLADKEVRLGKLFLEGETKVSGKKL